ncbi:BamA/TamA family outer membrane protein [Rhodohalobacter halophilus]|uniref:BamA/TamA family outer membrane protein n=1 Tax=Rhodohalobacter halophilus TaxID=1812810 RepID=UPI00083FBA28|nr:BamA/TamA family outer membrane protein [Rhodohalobacter halophilus]
MKTVSTLFLLLIVFTADLSAQGFNSLNGRNHPYLNWQVAETEHFKIIYPDRIGEIISQAAAVAEESYSALSSNLEVEFSKKIPIYLSDEDEIVNGFANPIGKGYTAIWVNLNDYADTWTGSEKWLRKVIAHELGHIFHFKAVWSDFGLLNYLIADPLPRHWTEGLAQYQTEYWDSQRGDRWLRKAIFDSRPGFNDGQSIENGRLLYAVGNSQLRYFTETYGDSSLVNLLSHRDKALGLEYHDFNSAFDEIVDGGYRSFYEEWRKHMNIYYNSLASQMERTDSLGTDKISLPGQFYFDMAVSPDGSQLAVLSLQSLARPVRYLHIVENDSTRSSRKVTEGSINSDLSWSSDGSAIYYSRTVRGERSSLLNDVYRLEVESGKEERLTHSRRAKYPTPGPLEDTIAYIVNENGTGNLFQLDLVTGEENRITNYRGDIQVIHPVWVRTKQAWLIHKFDEMGNRLMVLVDPLSGRETVIDHGDVDNRRFVLNPAGNKVAFTSLRDEVPNVFLYDFETETEQRVTNLFTGGEAYGWFTLQDSLQSEKLIVKASESKRSDQIYFVDANRSYYSGDYELNPAYASWRDKQAPNWIPSSVEPNQALIQDRYDYQPLKNIKHAATIVLPYYGDSENWGLFGTVGFTEPLGKHLIATTGNLSFGNPDHSYGILSYINNQLYPTISTSIYKTPGNAYFYGDTFLVEELIGGDITVNLPVDAFEAPYQNGSVYARLRHVLVRPFDRDAFSDSFLTPVPERARQSDLTIGFQIKKQRPWRNNVIHPLDGWGVRGLLTGAEKMLGSDVRFATADLSAYSVFPSIGLQRFYVYGRYQQQWGSPLPQDFIGFSRLDNIHLNLPGEVPLDLFNQAERVRGYRSFIAGNRVAFGSIEYRVPFLPSLNTTILGLIDLGSTSVSLFTDAGVVWNARFEDGSTGNEERWGAGAELKNSLNFGGIRIAHAIGIAQPTKELFTDADYDLYYRVRATVPF